MKTKVTLTVEGTIYVPIRATELQRLRAVDKAARDVISAATTHALPQGKHRSVAGPTLRKLARAVQGRNA